MKSILTLILVVSSQLVFANVQSQNETSAIFQAEPNHSVAESVQTQVEPVSDLTLIENLLSGMDFRLDDAVIASKPDFSGADNFFVTLNLIITDKNNQQTSISLFTSDDFSASEGYVALSKEFFVSGSEMFRALEPNITEIEASSNIHLSVSLHRSDLAPLDGRKLGEATPIEAPTSIYSSQLSFSNSSLGFKQAIELPETFSFQENSEITDLGFGLYFR